MRDFSPTITLLIAQSRGCKPMLYGLGLFGTNLSGDCDADPPEPLVPFDLMPYLPNYYSEIREFRDLLEAEGYEITKLWRESESLLAQFFVPSATWALNNWESELGLLVDPTKPCERRREQIRAKLRGVGTTTKQMIIDTAAAFSGGEVDVIEFPSEYRFVIQFVGFLGVPPNMAGFIQMIEQIKPAHLAYSFAYSYTTWEMLRGLSWNQAGSKTWDALKTYEGSE